MLKAHIGAWHEVVRHLNLVPFEYFKCIPLLSQSLLPTQELLLTQIVLRSPLTEVPKPHTDFMNGQQLAQHLL